MDKRSEEMELFSLKKRKMRRDMVSLHYFKSYAKGMGIMYFQCHEGWYKTRGAFLSRGKICQLDNRENFPLLKIVKHWNSWLWEIAEFLHWKSLRTDKRNMSGMT